MHNQLWFGDNLDILEREIPDQSVDLVYLDPPFNSKARYNLLYEATASEREAAQQTVFRDSWSWGDEAEFCFERVLAAGGEVAGIVNALTLALRRSDMMAYLVMMAARLRVQTTLSRAPRSQISVGWERQVGKCAPRKSELNQAISGYTKGKCSQQFGVKSAALARRHLLRFPSSHPSEPNRTVLGSRTLLWHPPHLRYI
jgi:hypothetical protein